MNEIVTKLEEKFDTIVGEFEKNPIKSTIKAAVIIYIVKTIWGWLKK